MGTSKSFGGTSGANPLLPSWLQPPPDLLPGDITLPLPATLPVSVPSSPGEIPPTQPTTPGEVQLEPAVPPIEVPTDSPTRFTGPRRVINTIARGTGSNTAKLRKATSDYVRKGLGGAGRAGSRMAVSAKTAGKIIGFIRSVEERGFVEAAKDFGIGDVTGKTPQEIGPLLAEAFLEQGGSIDEGISNRAWIETIVEAIESDLTDINTVNAETMIVMLENYVTRTIEMRLQQDIGAKILQISRDAARANQVKQEIHQLIRGEVRRAIRPVLQSTNRVEKKKLSSVGIRVYRHTFEYLQQMPAEE